MSERQRQLEQALRAFLELAFEPDAAPGPSFYVVRPVAKAREALRNARALLEGRRPPAADDERGDG